MNEQWKEGQKYIKWELEHERNKYLIDNGKRERGREIKKRKDVEWVYKMNIGTKYERKVKELDKKKE